MDRRAFIGSLAGGLLAAPRAAGAQTPPRKPRIGVLGATPSDPSLVEAFAQGLADSGYVGGRDVTIEHRHADGEPDRLPGLAAELVRSRSDVLFARGAGALTAARNATSTIPIVAVDFESDPVAMGFVHNLARPGGNVTGVFLDVPELSGKQLQLLRDIIPNVSRVAVLGDPVLNAPQFRATDLAARNLAIQLQKLEVRAPADLSRALEAAQGRDAGAVILLSSPLVFVHRSEIGSAAATKRLPAVSMFVEFAEAGGLMVYGPSLRDAFRRCAGYVARILRGARPGGLPVERPEKFDLVINLRTAKTLGLAIPPSLLARADRVIE
ncbi:MAG TPA: ABC transporter substrate-binding protein [Methylomirabilota bacterium]